MGLKSEFETEGYSIHLLIILSLYKLLARADILAASCICQKYWEKDFP